MTGARLALKPVVGALESASGTTSPPAIASASLKFFPGGDLFVCVVRRVPASPRCAVTHPVTHMEDYAG